jgi:hypothetical protein
MYRKIFLQVICIMTAQALSPSMNKLSTPPVEPRLVLGHAPLNAVRHSRVQGPVRAAEDVDEM